MNSKFSAFEKLSFTKNNNFQVSWQDRLNEIMKVFNSEKANSELNFYREQWSEFLLLKQKESENYYRQIVFSLDLEAFWYENSTLIPIRFSTINQDVDFCYAESDLFLLDLLRPYFVPDDCGNLKLDLRDVIKGELTKNFVQAKMLVQIGKSDEPFIYFESDLYEFCFTVEASEQKSDTWKIWGEYQIASPSTSALLPIDLWKLKKAYASFIVTSDDKYFHINSNSDKAILFAQLMASQGPLLIPQKELSRFFYEIHNLIGTCQFHLPAQISLSKESLIPLNLFYLKTVNGASIFSRGSSMQAIEGQVWFRYEKFEIPAVCHRSDKRLCIIGHQQEVDSAGQIFIKLFTPNEKLEALALQQVNNLSGTSFDTKKNIFKISYEYLHLVIGTILENVVESDPNEERLSSYWEVWAENLKIKLLNQFSLMISSLDVGFRLEFEDSSRAQRIESWQLIHVLKKKSAFIRLDDGSIGVLPQKWLMQLEYLYRNANDDGIINNSALFDFIQADNNFDFNINADTGFNQRKELLEAHLAGVQPKSLDPSDEFNGTLFDYQRQGLGWLVLLDEIKLGGLLADDMGLGKTIQVLAFLDYIKVKGGGPNLLIVPKSVLAQWQSQAREFTPKLKVDLLKPQDLRSAVLTNTLPKADLFITTYGVLRRYCAILKRIFFERVILDEAQIIKNKTSKVSIAAKSLNCARRLALTGTPIENHLNDFFSLIEFLNPGLLDTNILNIESKDQVSKVFQKLNPLVLRRKKEDFVMGLPAKNEEVITLELSNSQREAYDKIRNYYSSYLESISNEREFNDYRLFFLEGMMRLRQICCDPKILVSDKENSSGDLISAKTNFIIKELEKLNNSHDSVLVFSQFTTFLRLLKQELESRGLAVGYLDGQTLDRAGVIDSFQKQSRFKIFLISLKTGGLGLNLTAANHCYIIEPWWNLAVESQAIDRIYRIGQTKNVFVKRLIAKDTIEEKMQMLQKLKFEQTQYLIESDSDFLNQITIQDFKNLFS